MAATVERCRESGFARVDVGFTCPICKIDDLAPARLAGRKVKCRSCASPIRIPSGATPVMPRARADTMTCPACAEEIKAAAIQCRFCGERFDVGGEGTAAEVSGYDLPMRVVGVAMCLLGGVGIGLAALAFVLAPQAVIFCAIRAAFSTAWIRVGMGLRRREKQAFYGWCILGALAGMGVLLLGFATTAAPELLLVTLVGLVMWTAIYAAPIGYTIAHWRRIRWAT